MLIGFAVPYVNLPVVGVAALVLIAVARLMRTRLPAGAAEGAFCAALTTVAFAAALHESNEARNELRRLTGALGAVSVAWFAAGLVPERGAKQGVRRRVFHSWAMLTGALLLSIALPLWAPAGSGQIVMSAYAAPGLALLALAVEVGDELLIWNSTRKCWRTDPESALKPHRSRLHPAPFAILNLIAVIAAANTLSNAYSAAAIGISAIAWFVAYHRHASKPFAAAGAVSVALWIVSASLAWLPGGVEPTDLLAHPRTAAGLSAAAIFLNWLARFWAQQLRDGRAWTTAGRLIPVVAQCSIVSGFACVGSIVSFYIHRASPVDADATTLAVCGFMGIVASLRLATYRVDGAMFEAAQFCAWPVALASAIPLAESAERAFDGGGIRWLAPAGIAIVLSLRSARIARQAGFTVSGMSWWTGAVPVIVTLLAVGLWSVQNAVFSSAAMTMVLTAAWIGIRASSPRRSETSG